MSVSVHFCSEMDKLLREGIVSVYRKKLSYVADHVFGEYSYVVITHFWSSKMLPDRCMNYSKMFRSAELIASCWGIHDDFSYCIKALTDYDSISLLDSKITNISKKGYEEYPVEEFMKLIAPDRLKRIEKIIELSR